MVAKPKPQEEKPRKMSQKERRQLAELEQEIETLEAEVSQIEAQLSDPSFFIEHASEAPALIEKLDKKKKHLETQMERWAELEALREASPEA